VTRRRRGAGARDRRRESVPVLGPDQGATRGAEEAVTPGFGAEAQADMAAVTVRADGR